MIIRRLTRSLRVQSICADVQTSLPFGGRGFFVFYIADSYQPSAVSKPLMALLSTPYRCSVSASYVILRQIGAL
jgi:hypothetical protein